MTSPTSHDSDCLKRLWDYRILCLLTPTKFPNQRVIASLPANLNPDISTISIRLKSKSQWIFLPTSIPHLDLSYILGEHLTATTPIGLKSTVILPKSSNSNIRTWYVMHFTPQHVTSASTNCTSSKRHQSEKQKVNKVCKKGGTSLMYPLLLHHGLINFNCYRTATVSNLRSW